MKDSTVLPDLRMFCTADFVPHEDFDPRRIDRLSQRIIEEGILKNPPVVAEIPGTQLYELYKPYLVPGLDWDWFDGNHAVFTHDDPAMSIDFREDAIVRLRAELFTIPRILGRIPQISWRGFPMSHITSWMIQYPQGRAFTQFARERDEMQRSEVRP